MLLPVALGGPSLPGSPNRAPQSHTRQHPSLEVQDCPSHLTCRILRDTLHAPRVSFGGLCFETRSLYPKIYLQRAEITAVYPPTPGFFLNAVFLVLRLFETGSHYPPLAGLELNRLPASGP